MKKKNSLLLAVVWSIAAIIWIMRFICYDHSLRPETIVLDGMTALLCIIGAIIFIVLYVVRKKEDRKKE